MWCLASAGFMDYAFISLFYLFIFIDMLIIQNVYFEHVFLCIYMIEIHYDMFDLLPQFLILSQFSNFIVNFMWIPLWTFHQCIQFSSVLPHSFSSFPMLMYSFLYIKILHMRENMQHLSFWVGLTSLTWSLAPFIFLPII
jgi:hypothetical protein